MSSEIGHSLKVTIFGESHGPSIGVVIDNLPAGERLDREEIHAFMARRAGGKKYTTPRGEADIPIFLSGFDKGVTTGAPLCAVIENKNVRSGDYTSMMDKPRPSHADYPAFVKYGGANDVRGGGHFSGRLTAPLCIAGAICMQILRRQGIRIGAHIAAIAGVHDAAFDAVRISGAEFDRIAAKDFPVIDDKAGERMIEAILKASSMRDSVGGLVECAVTGMPVGIGAPLFGGVENRISAAVFGIGAVRGIEFGTGFQAAEMTGSVHNDAYRIEDGEIHTATNHHGGVIGGLTTGMPVIFRAAFKPTPSIGQEQETVSLSERTNAVLTIEGRHDPCIVPRAVPCVEAAAAITILDLLLEDKRISSNRNGVENNGEPIGAAEKQAE